MKKQLLTDLLKPLIPLVISLTISSIVGVVLFIFFPDFTIIRVDWAQNIILQMLILGYVIGVFAADVSCGEKSWIRRVTRGVYYTLFGTAGSSHATFADSGASRSQIPFSGCVLLIFSTLKLIIVLAAFILTYAARIIYTPVGLIISFCLWLFCAE